MTHEINFLVVAGGNFHGTNELHIPFGMKVECEEAFVNAITK